MRFARRDHVTAERSGDRVVVLDAAGTVLSTLSPVGTIVWERLPGSRAELVEHLQERFGEVAAEVLAADLERFLAELVAAELIVEIDAAG